MAILLIAVGALVSVLMANPFPFLVCLAVGLTGRKAETQIQATGSGAKNTAVEAAAGCGWWFLFVFLLAVAAIVAFGIATVGPGGIQ